MSWTKPGQGYNLNELKMSKFKFKMNSKKDQEGQGPASGIVVAWKPSDRNSINITAPEPLSSILLSRIVALRTLKNRRFSLLTIFRQSG